MVAVTKKKGGLAMVYILANNGKPLMPTEDHRKVRLLLKQQKAVVVRRTPFTIRLKGNTHHYTQQITLGIDAGAKHIGVSAVTEKKELYAAEVELRTDIVDLLSTRRELRCSRRNRKTRYRKPRFENRKRPEGWIAPSIKQKIGTHKTVIRRVHQILPVKRIVVEVASFDIQKIRDSEISGTGYQQGEQLGFWNVREYVLFRDGHTCQCCKGRSKDPVLNVHHIESRKTGGDAPNNLITLCETCHSGYHKGTIQLPKTIRRGMVFREAAFMGIMRWAFYNWCKEEYPEVALTYGYITKNTRIRHGLPKSHAIDARCITGHPNSQPLGSIFYQKKVRCHNRRLHKNTIQKGGIRRANQAPYLVKGYRLFDKVRYKSVECFIFGRRSSGSFDIRMLSGERISAGVSCKKLTLLEPRTSFLTERRPA